MSQNNNYGNESIKALSTKEQFRLRPDVWLQSHDVNAVKHTLVEVIANALDEVRYCLDKGLPCLSKIEVKRYADHSMSVKDYGRGIPMDYNNAEGKYNYELIFLTPFAGGKYSDEGAYQGGFVVGMNGVGLTVTQYTSEYLEAIVRRDGNEYRVSFSNGDLVGEMTKTPCETLGAGRTGSFIKWKPSDEVFTDVIIEDDYFANLLGGMAIVSNITIEFEDEVTGTSTVFKGEKYNEFFNKVTPDRYSLTESFNKSGSTTDEKDFQKNRYSYHIEGVVAITNDPSKIFLYHNMVSVSNGIHIDSMINAFTKAIISECDIPVRKADVETLLRYVSAFIITKSTSTSYDGQAKHSVLNRGLKRELEAELTQVFQKLLAKNRSAKELVVQLLKARRKTEEDLKKIEKSAEKLRKTQEKIYEEEPVDLSKFLDCIGSVGAELYIVEGDSAMGSCKYARDSQTQAVMAVRGKILNCLKQDMASILSNDIVLRLVKIIGEKPAISALRVPQKGKYWEKIIICTDADEDGFQIRTLLITFFYKVYPHLLEQGRVYIVESPLFEITTNKGTLYAYSNEERDKIINNADIEGYKVKSVQRSKGLGENDPEMMWDTTMNPATRRLIQVSYDPAEEEFSSLTHQMFEALLGDDLENRRNLIVDYMASNPYSPELFA